MTGIMIELTPLVALAFEVISGAWGNGQERKQKLEAAGYDYKKIQSCVDELMKIINKYGGE